MPHPCGQEADGKEKREDTQTKLEEMSKEKDLKISKKEGTILHSTASVALETHRAVVSELQTEVKEKDSKLAAIKVYFQPSSPYAVKSQ